MGNKIIRTLCINIRKERFDWKKYCTPQTYYGTMICVTPLHCSYGLIGYTVHFPYTNMPKVTCDWELNKLSVDDMDWEEYLGA